MKKLITLRSLLFAQGLTQVALARASGVPRQYISFAIGGRYSLKEEEIRKISEVLGESPERVFPELQLKGV